MKRLIISLVILILSFTLVSCAPGTAESVVETQIVEVEKVVENVVTATPESEPSILRFAAGYADLGTMDPHFASSTGDRSLVDMIFNGLLRYKPGESDVFEPDLAVAIPEPEMVDGKQVWTFQLKEGVMVHESEEVASYELTSEDVVYSFEKASDPERSAYSGEYAGMTFEAVGDYTVKITLDVPLSPILFFPKIADYAGGFIVPKKSIEAMGDDTFKTHAVGTGPFMVYRYFPLQKVELVANEDYFRGRPLLDGVQFNYVKDLTSRQFGYEAGELDLMDFVGSDALLDPIRVIPDTEIDIFGVAEVITIHMNQAFPPLDDIRVRQAIAYTLSRDEFVALSGGPAYAPVYSPVPAQFLAGGLTQEEVAEAGVEYAVDREKAKELLADAGYSDGFSLDVFVSESASYTRTYQSMQAQLAEVGIELNITMVDHSSMHSMIREGLNPITVYMAWRPNADVYLTRFYHSNSIVVTGVKPDTNFSLTDNIDDMIEAARMETDPDAQVQYWKDAQLQLLEDCVTKSLMSAEQTYIRRSWVDYGHELKSSLALYPQITELTQILPH